MRALLRRYWHPIAGSAGLDMHPSKPMSLLGEDLVLFRDLSGRRGLVDRQLSPSSRRFGERLCGAKRPALRVPRLGSWRRAVCHRCWLVAHLVSASLVHVAGLEDLHVNSRADFAAYARIVRADVTADFDGVREHFLRGHDCLTKRHRDRENAATLSFMLTDVSVKPMSEP